MNSTGWWVASILAGTVACVAGVGWSAIYWTRGPGDPRWKSPTARVLLPLIAVVAFLAVAYGASHMFDPVPR